MSKKQTKKTLTPEMLRQALIGAVKKLNPRYMIKNPVMFVVEIGFFITLLLAIVPSLFGETDLRQALIGAVKKLNPRYMIKNPVMFVVEIGFFITLLLAIVPSLFGETDGSLRTYNLIVSMILLVTVLFANFAESVAEGRGKAQAASLKKTQKDTEAHRLDAEGRETIVSSSDLKKGDVVMVTAGEVIPGDGEVIEGIASVDESAITGESAPVVRESGGDFCSVDVVMVTAGEVIPGDGEVIEGIASVDESAITGESAPVVRESGGDFCSVTGGTTVVSDWLKIRITSDPGNSFLDRMIALVEGASRKKTPNEIALNTLLVSLTIIFLIVIVTLYPIGMYCGVQLPVSTLIALMICLIPTTIGGLLSAIGIAGMDRVTRFNVIAMSGKAVEACGDVDTMILDKTGTITFGNRLAADFLPVDGVARRELIRCAALTSLHDDTPEGKSTLELARKQGDDSAEMPGAAFIEFTAQTRLIRCAALTSLHDDTPEGKSTLELARKQGDDSAEMPGAAFIEFTAQTRMSGVDLPDGTSVRKGASDAIEQYVRSQGGEVPTDLHSYVEKVSALGGTPLVVCENHRILGVIYLKDTVKPGMAERFARLRAIGIKTIMCRVRKGASDAIEQYVRAQGGEVPTDLHSYVEKVSALGGTPLVVCENHRILGVIYLKDTVKPGMAERFARLRAIGIKTIMCTGDNPLTAATIAKEAGVDGFIAECKPEDKISVIKKEQAEGKIVAMTGDGTNDAPALAQANVGLAMNSGTTAAKEAANMVDLDSDPTKILEVVEIGKQLLITRGSLTTFSIANDIAKYFAIIPAMFMAAVPQLGVLNIMGLTTQNSAILSALIFNALIIPCLIPLAMKGVKYRPMSSGKLLARNMLIYGLGGVITPFVGIKLIDLLIAPVLVALGM